MWACSSSILHGIGHILACLPSILHGISYMWACSPSILHGIGHIWACSPSILHGISYMWACSPSILHGIGHILACSPSILHGICYMWACSPSILYGICIACLPFCMGFSTCEHAHHIIMPTPRDLIHFGMATFTTSSCHPQAFKRRLVRKNASCGRWSWLAFTPSCSPHHHANPN